MMEFTRLLRPHSTAYSLARLVVGSRVGRWIRRAAKVSGTNRSSAAGANQPRPSFLTAGTIPRTTAGRIRVSLFSRPDGHSERHGDAGAPLSHRHTWVRGPGYQGVEDNDLRGFVDGRYVAAWNQPGQVHVRIGRKYVAWAQHGDRELFRVLQRWSGVQLPSEAVITGARLELEVEEGVDRGLEILLYEVNRDWNPGEGGLLKNNNSAPADGEVWWNEARHGRDTWGLPGAGFASDTHPRADTPATPLALTRYEPGDTSIAFESKELAAYIERRVGRNEPLLFLVKLADYLEDMPGTSIDVYSCNHGDDRNTARRPRLIVNWKSARESARYERHVILEHGRTITLPRITSDDFEGVAVSFEPDEEQERPQVSIRSGSGDTSSAWMPAEFPQRVEGDWIEVRLDAAVNPLPIGEAFIAESRDTWVTTGPPEDQKVAWTFTSPSGSRHTELAEYVGHSTWRIHFVPDELGRWHYEWFNQFTRKPFESAIGTFDVVPGDRDNALRALDRLVEQMKGSTIPPGRRRGRAFSVAFNRLQRGLLRYETPESFPLSDSGPDGGETGARLDDAREAIGGSRPERARLEIDDPDGVNLS